MTHHPPPYPPSFHPRVQAKELLACPRTELQLLPYYARIATTLGAVLKDMGATVVAGVEEEYGFLAGKKGDQFTVDAKVNCELTQPVALCGE